MTRVGRSGAEDGTEPREPDGGKRAREAPSNAGATASTGAAAGRVGGAGPRTLPRNSLPPPASAWLPGVHPGGAPHAPREHAVEPGGKGAADEGGEAPAPRGLGETGKAMMGAESSGAWPAPCRPRTRWVLGDEPAPEGTGRSPCSPDVFRARVRAALEAIRDHAGAHTLCVVRVGHGAAAPGTDPDADTARRALAGTVMRSVRSCDPVAWLATDTLGVLLEDCNCEQAQPVAAAIEESLRAWLARRAPAPGRRPPRVTPCVRPPPGLDPKPDESPDAGALRVPARESGPGPGRVGVRVSPIDPESPLVGLILEGRTGDLIPAGQRGPAAEGE